MPKVKRAPLRALDANRKRDAPKDAFVPQTPKQIAKYDVSSIEDVVKKRMCVRVGSSSTVTSAERFGNPYTANIFLSCAAGKTLKNTLPLYDKVVDKMKMNHRTRSITQSLQDDVGYLTGKKCWSGSEFVILDKIGKGGGGTVYKARHKKTGHLVALKELELDRMGRNEMKWHPKFDNEAILTCYGSFIGFKEGVISMTKKWPDQLHMKGFLILELCTPFRWDCWTPIDIADILNPLVDALKYLEQEFNLTHNDVKPANLLVTSRKTVVLADFGLVCEIGRGKIPTGLSYQYASPEVLSLLCLFKRGYGFDLSMYTHDAKTSDIWSIGVMVYQLWFGNCAYWFGRWGCYNSCYSYNDTESYIDALAWRGVAQLTDPCDANSVMEAIHKRAESVYYEGAMFRFQVPSHATRVQREFIECLLNFWHPGERPSLDQVKLMAAGLETQDSEEYDSTDDSW